MVSDFRKKKILQVFKHFDTDGSGSIEKKDIEAYIENASKTLGWPKGGEKYKFVEDSLMKVWEGISGADANSDGKVSEAEWIAIWEKTVSSGQAPEWQNLYCKYIFSVFDATNDGSIDCDEFTSVSVKFGLNKDDVVAAFQKMSKGKSKVSWAEYQELWKEYFSSEDVNAPGNFIFADTSF